MKVKIYALALGLLGLAFSPTAVQAQTPVRTCSSMEVLAKNMAADPSLAQQQTAINNQALQFAASGQANQRETAVTVTIPVVVHVVYNTAAQNISDAQIATQIAVLNEDYQKLNADVSKTPGLFTNVVGNVGIAFTLAKRDPNGNATTGIVRKQTTVTTFIDNDYVKDAARGGDNAWPASQYLNLWVCNLGGGLLGYAQFPGGGPASTDGVVILHSAFGSRAKYSAGTYSSPYDLGRTATHEVGHWLALEHIWGGPNAGPCGDDKVSDTPTQAGPNFNCPAFPHVTCSNQGDMSMNYMDYTDDACMYMFSKGQSTRMNALFASGGVRASMTNSLGGTPPGTTYVDVAPGVYKLYNRNSGQVLEIGGAAPTPLKDGAFANQWPDTGTSNQQWNIASAGNGACTIFNRNSNQVLEIQGAYTWAGGPANQHVVYWAGANQQWLLKQVGNSGYYNIINSNSRMALEISGGAPQNTQPGARAYQWNVASGTSSSAYAQQWSLIRVNVPTSNRFDGVYTIKNVNSNLVLGIPNGTTDAGTEIVQQTYANNATQQWTLTDAGSGLYNITNRNSRLVLDIRGGTTNGGEIAQQWYYQNSLNQQWNITEITPGVYTLVRPNSNMALEIQGAYTWDGVHANQWPYWGGTNQQWILNKVAQNRGANTALATKEQTTEDKEHVLLYPNPANSLLRISLPGAAKATSVTVHDVRGALMSGIRNLGDGQVDVSSLAGGVYFITVSAGEQQYHQKFIKQ